MESEPISLLELYADFCLVTGLMAPVQVVSQEKRRRGHRPGYMMRSDSIVADSASRSLSIQSHFWSRFMRWFRLQIPAFQNLEIIPSRSLRRVGYRLCHIRFSRRTKLVSGILPYQVLAGYFNTSCGKRRSLSGVFQASRV